MEWVLWAAVAVALFAWDYRRRRRTRGAEDNPDKGSVEVGLARLNAARGATAPKAAPAAPEPPAAPSQPTARPVDTRPLGPVPAAVADTVEETVAVVLRRQVPPRFDQPARSWLGGLPSMPAALEWPRSVSAEHPDRGERPLHFVAQVCCADLPADLWGGLGPRTGWLLLFVDPNQGTPDGPDAFRILHTPELGEERAPPFDLGPVHDGVYTGPDYRHLLPGENVPATWRRWPVDLVPVPNELHGDGVRTMATPPDFATTLYGGAEIRAERPPLPAPFTSRGLVHALADMERSLPAEGKAVPSAGALGQNLREPAAYQDLIDRCSEDVRTNRSEAAALAGTGPGDPLETDVRQRRRAFFEAAADRSERAGRWLADCGSADGVLAYLDESSRLEQQWRDRVREQIATVRARIAAVDPDSPLSADAWTEIVAELAEPEFRRWSIERQPRRDGTRPWAATEKVLVPTLRPPAAMHHLVADYSLDPDRAGLVPAEVRATYEAWWRSLTDNRPHRMGGYHDGVQSDADPGPSRDLLVFQIASDDALHWVWGDTGAYYFRIRTRHLAALDFSGVEMQLECH